MADVCLAVAQGSAGFNKLVVIKKARPELAHDPEFPAMFLDEARLAARLNHPSVTGGSALSASSAVKNDLGKILTAQADKDAASRAHGRAVALADGGSLPKIP
jgi:serine/threonine protein kinase